MEVSGDGDGAGKEDGLEADAGSGEDKTEFLFQPEWPEVTYFTTDLKQAGTEIVNFNGVNKLFMNVINKSTTNEKLSQSHVVYELICFTYYMQLIVITKLQIILRHIYRVYLWILSEISFRTFLPICNGKTTCD